MKTPRIFRFGSAILLLIAILWSTFANAGSRWLNSKNIVQVHQSGKSVRAGADPDYYFSFHTFYHSPDLTPGEVFQAFDKFFWADLKKTQHTDYYLVQWGVWSRGDKKGDLAEIQLVLNATDPAGIAEVDRFVADHTGKKLYSVDIEFNKINAVNLSPSFYMGGGQGGKHFNGEGQWFLLSKFSEIDSLFGQIDLALKKKDKTSVLNLLSPYLTPSQLDLIEQEFEHLPCLQFNADSVFLTKADRGTGHETSFYGWSASSGQCQ